jgi:hypothetical protein
VSVISATATPRRSRAQHSKQWFRLKDMNCCVKHTATFTKFHLPEGIYWARDNGLNPRYCLPWAHGMGRHGS